MGTVNDHNHLRLRDRVGAWFSERTIAFLALVVGLGSFFYTCQVQHDQDHRWDVVNLARMDLRAIDLVVVKRVSQETASTFDPMYNWLVNRTVEKGVASEDFAVQYELAVVRTDKQPFEPFERPVYTRREAEEIRAVCQGRAPNVPFEIRAHVRIFCDVVNGGATEATEARLSLIGFDESGHEAGDMLKAPSPGTCPPGEGLTGWYDIYFPLDSVAGNARFIVQVEYRDINGKFNTCRWPVSWTAERNAWVVEPKQRS